MSKWSSTPASLIVSCMARRAAKIRGTSSLWTGMTRAIFVAGARGDVTGGMGRKGYVCGAVTGALMALGLKNGGKPESKEKNYADTVKFWDKFTEAHGSVICRQLLEYDISTPEGLKKMKELNLHEKVCAKLVAHAAELLAKEFLCE